jgi:Tfp pilus assembly protein FimT
MTDTSTEASAILARLATARAEALREAAEAVSAMEDDALARMRAAGATRRSGDMALWAIVAAHLDTAEATILALIDKEAPDA